MDVLLNEKVLQWVLTILTIIFGSKIWEKISDWLKIKEERKKINAETHEKETDIALKAMLQSLEFLKTRVADLDRENSALRTEVYKVSKELSNCGKELERRVEEMERMQKQLDSSVKDFLLRKIEKD